MSSTNIQNKSIVDQSTVDYTVPNLELASSSGIDLSQIHINNPALSLDQLNVGNSEHSTIEIEEEASQNYAEWEDQSPVSFHVRSYQLKTFLNQITGDIVKKTKKVIKKQKLGLMINRRLKQKCSICLKTTRNTKTIYKLTCRHGFHKQCLSQWRDYSQKCPLCRRELL